MTNKIAYKLINSLSFRENVNLPAEKCKGFAPGCSTFV